MIGQANRQTCYILGQLLNPAQSLNLKKIRIILNCRNRYKIIFCNLTNLKVLISYILKVLMFVWGPGRLLLHIKRIISYPSYPSYPFYPSIHPIHSIHLIHPIYPILPSSLSSPLFYPLPEQACLNSKVLLQTREINLSEQDSFRNLSRKDTP